MGAVRQGERQLFVEGHSVSCSIALDGLAPTDQVHPDGAECSTSGSIDGNSFDVSSFSMGVPDSAADESDEGSAIPDEIVVTEERLAGGVFVLESTNAWDLLDAGNLTTWEEAGFVEPRALTNSDIVFVASGQYLGGDSNFTIEQIRRPLSYGASLEDLIDEFQLPGDSGAAEGAIATGLTGFAGVEAAQYVTEEEDGVTRYRYVFRAGTDTFVVSAVDRDDSGVGDLLASMRVVPEELNVPSHWTRLAINGFAEQGWMPEIALPADARLVDDQLLSDVLDLRVTFSVFVDFLPMEELAASMIEDGGVESSVIVDGVPSRSWEFVNDERLVRRTVTPLGDTLVLETSIDFPAEQVAVIDKIIERITLT